MPPLHRRPAPIGFAGAWLCAAALLAAPAFPQHTSHQPSSAGTAIAPTARWVAGDGVTPGVSSLVGTWSASGSGGVSVEQDEMRSWPRLDTTMAAGRPALVFDGNDGFTSAFGTPGGSYSRAIAVRVDDLAAGGIVFGVKSGEGLRVLPGSGVLAYEQGGVSIQSTLPVTEGAFHTILTTFDAVSGVGRMYLDGAPAGQGTLPMPAEYGTGFAVSKYGGLPLTGAIAEARIYDYVLPPAERVKVEGQLAIYQNPFPEIEFTTVPRDAQIFQRDAFDTAQVVIEGTVSTLGYDSIELVVERDDAPFTTRTIPLSYGMDGAPFLVSAAIDAGFFDYDVTLSLIAGRGKTVVKRIRNLCSGDAFLVDGQSNAVAKDWHAEGFGDDHQSPWIRSFGDGQWVKGYGPPPLVSTGEHNKDLNWDIARSLVPHNHATIGQWALRMAALLSELSGMPIAVINGGSEGSSILAHLRNDSDHTDPSGLYGRLLYRAQHAGIAETARAFIYYQGEADGPIPEVWASSFEEMKADWHDNYTALERVYVMQIREGCSIPNDGVREAQRKLGELHADLSVMSTTAVPTHDICHYYHLGYLRIGENMARMIARDLYGQALNGVDPPAIVKAEWESGAQDALILTFDPPSTTLLLDPGVEGHTSVSDGVQVNAVTVHGPSQLRLELAGPSTATGVTWRGHTYDGPWITNAGGVGALTFFDYPITP